MQSNTDEIVFTRNASESLNLIAYSFGNLVLRPGDEVLVSIMEHHSNLLQSDSPFYDRSLQMI